MAGGERKFEVEVARQLYLYGEGDGVRIFNVKELAAKSQLTPGTIRKWIPEWAKEVELKLAKTTPLGRNLVLRDGVEEAHRADSDFLRDQINQVKYELKIHEEVLAKLEGICDNFSLNTENGDQAIQLFKLYIQGCGNKSNLRKQFLALESRWTKISGVDAIQDIAKTSEMESARVQGKKKAEQLNEGVVVVRDATPAGFFAKPKH